MGPHRGGGGPGAREAERGFRYINLSATVANHRLPASHHGSLFLTHNVMVALSKPAYPVSRHSQDQCWESIDTMAVI